MCFALIVIITFIRRKHNDLECLLILLNWSPEVIRETEIRWNVQINNRCIGMKCDLLLILSDLAFELRELPILVFALS